MADQEKGMVHLPIEWVIPEQIISRYATNLVVQHTEHEFVISFFEVHPPIVLGTPEERKVELAKLQSLKAECIARVVVSTERMPEFIKVLQENLKRYEESINKPLDHNIDSE